jgi:deoxyribodipyrimidine photo-lyase
MTTAHYRTALVWFRRDLRCFDHTALHTALTQADQVYAVFVFDRDILDALPSRYDRRVEFIWHALGELDTQLRQRGGGLMVLQGKAREEIPRLAAQLGVEAVMTHHDYEPQAVARDAAVAAALQQQGRAWLTFKDTVIFEKTEVLTGAGKPFSVFTPYKNAWLKKLTPAELAPRSCEHGQLAMPLPGYALPDLATLGFEHTNLLELGLHPGMTGAQTLLDDFATRISAYAERRDFPALKGPSYLSVHLRFGTVSIRQLARLAHAQYLRGDRGAEVWLSELVWRDFYFQILANFPHVVERSFKPDYDRIPWEGDETLFQAWCQGRTGYPLVDAAMAQINQTGYMHNRLRMVVASFLTKDLGLDWRWGEAYFAAHLNDFDLAANNGGWQWAASTGCDAQPYFRIFNPVSQSEKFDAEGKFIRKYVPALAKLSKQALHAPWEYPLECELAGIRLGVDYPLPVVRHDEARKKTLARYAVVKG